VVTPPVEDGDADGVPDGDDDCPAVPGTIANAGCPEEGGPTPGDALELGKPRLNREKGTAKLPVGVSGPGSVKLSGRGVKRVLRAASGAGTVTLAVKPKGAAAETLDERGRVKVRLQITFASLDGPIETEQTNIRLRAR
jgi:hypothetical protein